MKTIYLSDKEKIIYDLKKRIANNNVSIELLKTALPVVHEYKHHKNITKRFFDGLSQKGIHASLQDNYSIRVNFYYPQDKRTYSGSKKCEYFECTEESIYINTWAWSELIEGINKRLEGLKESNEKLQNELDNIDSIYNELLNLQKINNEVCNSYSYILTNNL